MSGTNRKAFLHQIYDEFNFLEKTDSFLTTPTTTTSSTTALPVTPKSENILKQSFEATVEKGESVGIPEWGVISILIRK